MKIAFIGYGNVGSPIANHLQQLGHVVTLAANDTNTDNVRKALVRNNNLKVTSPQGADGPRQWSLAQYGLGHVNQVTAQEKLDA